MVFNSIFVILGITAALLVLSLQLFFRSKKKPKSFGVYFLIPICVALMALYGLGLGLHNELKYQNAIREQREFLTDFADDFEYYLECYKNILDYYHGLDSEQQANLFKTDYNFEPTLDASRLKFPCQKDDTFATYFLRLFYASWGDGQTYAVKIYYTFSVDDRDFDDELSLIIHTFSGMGSSYGTPDFIWHSSDYQENMGKLGILRDCLTQGNELNVSGLRYVSDEKTPFSITEYIIMLVYVALIWLFAVATMIMVFVKGGNNAPAAVEQNSGTATQPTAVAETPAPPKLKWEELSQDEQKPYLENAIQELYESQLKNPSLLGLSRQQIAMREYALHNKQFYLEDLSEIEVLGIQKAARSNYENGVLPNSKKVNTPTTKNKEEYRQQRFKSKAAKLRLWLYIGLGMLAFGIVLMGLSGYLFEKGVNISIVLMFVSYMLMPAGFICMVIFLIKKLRERTKAELRDVIRDATER